jgi:hypothetical protein
LLIPQITKARWARCEPTSCSLYSLDEAITELDRPVVKVRFFVHCDVWAILDHQRCDIDVKWQQLYSLDEAITDLDRPVKVRVNLFRIVNAPQITKAGARCVKPHPALFTFDEAELDCLSMRSALLCIVNVWAILDHQRCGDM